mmetsp:Transcript_2614/g.6221  ORF Transcript_2614/g.6221 Transcript_2614/m.6221 type:complete len:248 (+) Transcript_2614:837-1580(+)
MVGGAVARGALQQPGNGVELTLHLLDHLHGGDADRLHGHGGEPVGQHGTDEQEGEHHGVEHVHATLQHSGARHKGGRQRQGYQCGGPNGKTLADGGGRVAGGIQRVGLLAHSLGQVRHLGDAPRVVADGAVHVDGQARGQRSQHSQRREGDAVCVHEREGNKHDTSQNSHRHHGGLVSECEPVNDVSSGACLCGAGHLADRRVGVRGEVLGNEADDQAAPQPSGDAAKRGEGAHSHTFGGHEAVDAG